MCASLYIEMLLSIYSTSVVVDVVGIIVFAVIVLIFNGFAA